MNVDCSGVIGLFPIAQKILLKGKKKYGKKIRNRPNGKMIFLMFNLSVIPTVAESAGTKLPM